MRETCTPCTSACKLAGVTSKSRRPCISNELCLSSERHAFGLQLIHPRAHTALSLVSFVVLVERKPQELAALHALGLFVGVAGGIDAAYHFCARCLESGVHLLNRIAEVVRVALRVPTPKNSHWLAGQVECLQLLQVVVPRGAGAVLICSRVPGRGADNEPVIARQVPSLHITNVRNLQPSGFRNDACRLLRVARLRRVEEAHRPHAAALPPAAGPGSCPGCKLQGKRPPSGSRGNHGRRREGWLQRRQPEGDDSRCQENRHENPSC
mmetsp:Transcript_56664/g.160862  ORF Transcript_56664/g.160862 Transcript_56664/m.160862 type:complete len:267 (-) Transcript_56664:89-889(-)